ncbi:STAS domain-containing protein [Speluncibacter jeojiensis]|uniref:STAS domain-containing protein n=1 Tax=Speluncibacter jeojiensis TaxID=2710754 RepID=A0A9X4LYY5_9ACTN|nr:STAS domain-containing protein [Corynebacteriales bacterium D3-21]
MPVPILKQGPYLIATVQDAFTDRDARRLQTDLMAQVGRYRSHGIVLDVTALDVMDSFAARTIQTIARSTRLLGADTVVVGLQPVVALAMVQLGLTLANLRTSLDLEQGLALLDGLRTRRSGGHRDGR